MLLITKFYQNWLSNLEVKNKKQLKEYTNRLSATSNKSNANPITL